MPNIIESTDADRASLGQEDGTPEPLIVAAIVVVEIAAGAHFR